MTFFFKISRSFCVCVYVCVQSDCICMFLGLESALYLKLCFSLVSGECPWSVLQLSIQYGRIHYTSCMFISLTINCIRLHVLLTLRLSWEKKMKTTAIYYCHQEPRYYYIVSRALVFPGVVCRNLLLRFFANSITGTSEWMLAVVFQNIYCS